MSTQNNRKQKGLAKFKQEESPQKNLLSTMIKGIIMLLPVILMLFIIVFLFNLVLDIISPIGYMISGGTNPAWFIHIISFLILLGLFYLAGIFISSRIGNIYFRQFEKAYLDNIPLYSTLRETVQQFSGTKEMPFQQVVLVDVLNSGCKMTGFVTQKINEDLYTIYIPTAPNPTNGNIFHMRKDQLDFIDIDSEEAMRTVISMGTGSHHLFEKLNSDQELEEE